MTCDEFEQQIFEDMDGALAPEQCAALETHQVACASCGEFARQARNLDSALSRRSATTTLPANFDSRLHERLRREKMELEFAEGLKRLKKGWWNSPTLAESICCAVVAAMVCWLGDWPLQMAEMTAPSFSIQLLAPTLADVLFLAAGLIAAFPLLRRTHTFQPWR